MCASKLKQTEQYPLFGIPIEATLGVYNSHCLLLDFCWLGFRKVQIGWLADIQYLASSRMSSNASKLPLL